MTTNKDFKRIVRARMSKTGESYTSARSQLTLQPSVRPSGRPTVDYAKLAGMSDEKVKKATGCAWESWVNSFDRVEAHKWTHREIVQYAHEKYKTPEWWAQMVVVGYERIKGLRDIGQRRDGRYEATKSRVFAVPISKLFRAFHDKRTRARWLPVAMTVRVFTKDKSMRVTWPDDTSVEFGFYAKGASKSSVALAHTKLTSKADAEARKAYWTERLDALAEILVPRAKKKSA